MNRILWKVLNYDTHHDVWTLFPYVWKALEIGAEFQSGKSLDKLTGTWGETRSVIRSVINRQTRIEKVQTKKFKRSHLSLADKLLVLNKRKIGTKPVDIQFKFKISQRTYYRLIASKDKRRDRENCRGSTRSKGYTSSKVPSIRMARDRIHIVRLRK